MKKIFLLLNLIILSSNAGFFGIDIFGKRATQTRFIISEYEEKKHKLEALKKELAKIEATEKDAIADIKKNIDTIEQEQQVAKDKKSKASVLDLDFLNKKEIILGEIKQALSDIQRARREIIYHIKKNIETLEQYIANPVFADLRIQDKASYQFSEFQNLSKQLLSAEEELNRYRDEKRRFEEELSNNKRQLEQLDQELKQKERLQQSFSPVKEQEDSANDLRQKSELIDWEIQLLKAKIDNLEEKRKEIQKELDLANLRIFIAKIKTDLFKKDLAKVDRKLWVNESDIQIAQSSLEEKKQENTQKQSRYSKELAALTAKRDKLQQSFDQINDELPTPVKDLRQLNEWLVDPKTVGDEVNFYKVAFLNDSLQTVERNIALLEAKQTLGRVRVAMDELQIEAMKAWLTITQRKLIHDEDDRQTKLNYFITRKADIVRELEELKNKDTAITNLMSLETRALSQIKHRYEKLRENRSLFVKQYGEAAYKATLEMLKKSQDQLNQQLDLNGQLIKMYSSITAILSDMKRQAEMVIGKLESIGGIWQRAAGALTWEGIKSTVPDLKFFWEDLVNIVSQSSVTDIASWFKQLFGDPINILNIIFALLLLAALYFVLAISLPLLNKLLMRGQRKYGWRFLSSSLASVLLFLRTRLLGIFVWITFFCVIRYEIIIDVGVRAKVFFYLLSIPYLCYLARAFIQNYLTATGKFMSDSFRRRFARVFQFFIFATIIILFFREAFLITTYGHSELPTILLAIYSIITRASLIFLIMTKELILDALPSRGKIWLFIKEQINQYYTIFLVIIIALIIMSDPFVGYSRLVSMVLQGALWTIILVVVFWWIQRVLKRYSSGLFFVSSGEGVRERFSYAKTWYALFIVVSFGILIIVVSFLFAKIWGYPVSFDNITNFFNFAVAHVRGDAPGETIPITIRSLLMLVAFIFGGFLIASVFNRYVLDRIYNLLQVDMGIQNTISRISSYLIVIIILIIGLQRIGLGGWIPGAIISVGVLIAFAIKGLADDFVSYFTILVERFIKIGDYIRIDSERSETSGIVRKITPRSVILRKKNSYSIIIPNSKITKLPILNWNYTRGYFAFEDLIVSVSYDANPVKVKDIFLKILDANPAVLKNPAPIIRINNFALSGYEFLVRGYLSSSNVLNQWDIRSDIRFAIVQEFDKNKIKLAVPIRDVKLERITKQK